MFPPSPSTVSMSFSSKPQAPSVHPRHLLGMAPCSGRIRMTSTPLVLSSAPPATTTPSASPSSLSSSASASCTASTTTSAPTPPSAPTRSRTRTRITRLNRSQVIRSRRELMSRKYCLLVRLSHLISFLLHTPVGRGQTFRSSITLHPSS